MTLHQHSEHSFLDGRARCDEIAAAALSHGYDHIAITDHDEVGGHLDHQRACLAAGIKPVFGTEARWLHSIAASREERTSGRDSSHMVLLAENRAGLRNLWALSSLAYEPENFYGKPQLEPRLLREYHAGLWASDGCGLTRFTDYVNADDEDAARREWGVLLNIFGDRFYSELHTFQIIDPQTEEDHNLNRRITVMNQAKMRFAQEMGVPLVAVHDAHYAMRHQWEEHRLVYNLSTQAYRKDQVDSKGQAADWLMSPEDTAHYLNRHGIPLSLAREAIANAAWIAGQCDVEITPTLSMPRLYASDSDDVNAFLDAISEGFKKFVIDKGLPEEVYFPRLEHEARQIVDKGMCGYLNVVADYVMSARSGRYLPLVLPHAQPKPCLCGPGRGSGGGSLVNYVLGITSLDPIKHDLSFERFLNPDRADYPDIDVDFQQSKRNDIKSYLGSRYGQSNVCSIGTRARSGPKQMLKDLARAMGIEFSHTLKMVDLLGEVDDIGFDDEDSDSEEDPPTWDEILSELGGDLAPWAKLYPELFQRLEQMVGLVRQAGVHAAGVVVNSEPILGNVPTRIKKGVRATQFDMHEIAELGGVKDDLLANKGLDVLDMARSMVYEKHRIWLDYDGFGFGVPADAIEVVTFSDELYDDPDIWEQIDNGQTAGIFQVGTPSGTKQAMKFKPRSLSDLADLVAINRPGVIRAGKLDSYLKRRNGQEPITYDHPLMEPITSRTMGILVYQEDMTRAAREIAGFTPGQGEDLRKAIGKKLTDKIADIKPRFISGCMNNPEFVSRNGTHSTATRIWSSLEAAGSYAFNRAHSVGYATQACWEIWTKHHFYDEFVTACLIVTPAKRKFFIQECRKRSRLVLPPDINQSGEFFTLTNDGIRYGLSDVRNVGGAAIPDIIKNRPYRSLADYLARTTPSRGGRKTVVEPLIKVGAFDSVSGGKGRQDLLDEYYYHRAALEVSPNKWLKLGQDQRDEIVAEKWKNNPEEYPQFPFGSEEFIYDMEVELLGTHVSVDPMEHYADKIEKDCIRHPSEIDDKQTGANFFVGGQLVKIKHHTQKNDRKMAFLTIRWAEEDFEVTAFADAWEANRAMLQHTGIPVILGVIKLSGRGCQLSTVKRLDWKDKMTDDENSQYRKQKRTSQRSGKVAST